MTSGCDRRARYLSAETVFRVTDAVLEKVKADHLWSAAPGATSARVVAGNSGAPSMVP